MKQVRFPLCLLSFCLTVLFGTQIAFAAPDESKFDFLLPVIGKLYEVLLREWQICGGIFLIGFLYAVIFILRRSKKPVTKTKKGV